MRALSSVTVTGNCNSVTNSTVLVVNAVTVAGALPPNVTKNPGDSLTYTAHDRPVAPWTPFNLSTGVSTARPSAARPPAA